MLYHCIYTSVQTHVLPDGDITQLVKHSRTKNAEHGLTGILLHVGNTFFQVLEGSAEAIDELYNKILKDPRHMQITRIIFETIPHRYFADSSMSLTALSPLELSQLLEIPGSEQQDRLLAGLDEGRAKKLLRAFSEGRWRAAAPRIPSSEALLA